MRIGTILLVEDNPDHLELYRRILSGENYRVITASSGKEALALLAQPGKDIGLLVLDHKLPDYTGAEVLAKYQEELRQTQRPVNVLILSAYEQNAIGQDYENFPRLSLEYIAKSVHDPKGRDLVHAVKKIADK